MRYSPKRADDIHDCVVMICQAYGNPPKLGKLASGNPYYGNPQSSASSLRGTPTAAWIKKFDNSKLVEFFGRGRRTRLAPRIYARDAGHL